MDSLPRLYELNEFELQELFIETIRKEADKADLLPNPQESYKVLTDYLGRTDDGLRTQYGFGNTHKIYNETFISLQNVVIRANNPYRRWVKLYEYCNSIDEQTTEKYLLPQFETNLYKIYTSTTPNDLVNMVLERYESVLTDNIYWVKLHEI